jgi:hypothetical protein
VDPPSALLSMAAECPASAMSLFSPIPCTQSSSQVYISRTKNVPFIPLPVLGTILVQLLLETFSLNKDE